MKTAITAALAATALLLAGPAAAQVSQADPQAIARSLMDQGYADVRVIEDDGELAVSATREGATRNFTYDRDSGRLVSSGEEDGDGPRERNDDDEGRGGGDEGRGSPEAGDDDEGGGREGDRGAGGDDGAGGDAGRDGGNDGGEGGGDDGGDEGAED